MASTRRESYTPEDFVPAGPYAAGPNANAPKVARMYLQGIRVEGGCGESPENAIVIHGPRDPVHGIRIEGFWCLNHALGNTATGQRRFEQNGHWYDEITFQRPDASTYHIYFDVTSFFQLSPTVSPYEASALTSELMQLPQIRSDARTKLVRLLNGGGLTVKGGDGTAQEASIIFQDAPDPMLFPFLEQLWAKTYAQGYQFVGQRLFTVPKGETGLSSAFDVMSFRPSIPAPQIPAHDFFFDVTPILEQETEGEVL